MKLTTAETYFDVLDGLEQAGVRYVVTSGMAVVLHGHKRLIVDLDIVIDPAPQEANRALGVLASRGFVSSLPLPPSMLAVLRMFDHSGREVDVFLGYHIPFDELWANSESLPSGSGGYARVASLEHLLKIKRTNGRPHDLLDIEGLLALEGRATVSTVEEPTSGGGGQEEPT